MGGLDGASYLQCFPADISFFNPGPSRCFPFWQDVLACYVVNTSTDDISGAKKCVPVLEDYYECLHHKKEVSQASPAFLGPVHSEYFVSAY